MNVAVYNFDYCQGTTHRFSIEPYTNAQMTNRLDMTNCNARGQIRLNAQHADCVQMQCEINGNAVNIAIPADALVNSKIPITGKTYKDVTTLYYDVEIVFPSGDVKRILQGSIKVSPEVTKDGG